MILKSITPHHFKNEPQALIYTPSTNLTKTAYATDEELLAKLKTLVMNPKAVYVLFNALGSWESYGANSNQDAFEKKELLPEDGSTASGYKTFESRGNLYYFHANKDPSKASGKTPGSFWNPVMNRVEVLVEMAIDKNADTLSKVERGIPVPCSMGTSVFADRCSWCSNIAPTRREYCDHILNQLGHIREDGLVCCMMNIRPVFFDLSIISVGADKSAWSLAKVASAGYIQNVNSDSAYNDFMYEASTKSNFRQRLQKVAGLPPSVQMAELAYEPEKQAVVRKVSDIDKVIPGNLTAAPGLQGLLERFRKEKLGPMRRDEAEIPSSQLDALADSFHSDVGGLLATLAAYGVVLKPREYQRLILGSLKGGRDLRDALDATDATFETVDPLPHSEDKLDFKPEHVDHTAMSGAGIDDIMARKSYHRGALLERSQQEMKNGEDEPIEIEESAYGPEILPLLARVGGSFVHYKEKATRFALEVGRAAAEIFPDTNLTIRLGIAPSQGHDASSGLTGMVMGATAKEAMASYPAALRYSGAEEVQGLKKMAAAFETEGFYLRAPGAAVDAMILRRMGLL